MAQTAIGVVGGSVYFGDVNWILCLSASGLAGVLSLLMSVAGLPEVEMAEKLEESKN
jgi:hypothetical protein